MCIADYIILNADAYVFKNVKDQDAYFAAVPIIGTIAHRVKPKCSDLTAPEYILKARCKCDREIRRGIVHHYREHRLSLSYEAGIIIRTVRALIKNRVPLIFNIAENMSTETLKRMANEDNFFEGMIGRFKSMEIKDV